VLDYPTVVRNDPGSFEVKAPWVSVDFEYNPNRPLDPTIMGLSSGGAPVSGFYNPAWNRLLTALEKGEVKWVGHNAIQVERAIIEAQTGQEVPIERMDDTMVYHYLCNAQLCKGVAKTEEVDDEDDEDATVSVDKRGVGYMGLWSMASLYTDLPVWKTCRGTVAEGPCPVHDPLGYNGVDAYAVDAAMPNLLADMKAKQIPDALYQRIKRLVAIGGRMEEAGIKVNRDLVRSLEKEFKEKKDSIFQSRMEYPLGKKGQPLKNMVQVWDAPFNPQSPKAVIKYFGENGVSLRSTDKDEIREVLKKLKKDVATEVREWLGKLYDFKDSGKGLKAWFDERYFDESDYLHPRFIGTATSTGRLSSANPNFQNIPRVGFGRNVRRVIVPRNRDLKLIKADKSGLEFRVALWYAGITPDPNLDVFKFLVREAGGQFEKAADLIGKADWTPRDIAKTVVHGGDNGEGIKVFYGKDLGSPTTKRMVAAGAIQLHPEWEYHGGIVGFTGVNLAERFFGDASWDNRRKALEIQDIYFKAFPQVRALQKKLSRDAENGYIRTASGRYLRLEGTPEDKIKISFSVITQGGGADDVIDGMLRYDTMGYTPLIQVHDELNFEVPREWTVDQQRQFWEVFVQPSTSLPGFVCPVKFYEGENWLDIKELGKL